MKKRYWREPFLKPYFEDKIYSFTLGKRIHFYLKQIPYVFSVNIGVWISAGSMHDPEGKEGTAHLIEHLIFKGTETRTDKDILSAIESKGGHINAYTTPEFSYIQVTVLPEHLSETFEIISDMLNNSTFESIEKEKKVVLEEIAFFEDSPEELINDIFNQFVWGKHPLAKPVSGTRESVERITKTDLRRFYNKWYRSGEIIVVVVGNIDEERLRKTAEKSFYYEKSDRKLYPRRKSSTPKFHPIVKHYQRDVSQVHFCLGFPAPGIREGEKHKYIPYLVSNILGGSSTSKLFYKIREQEGLAYNIYSNYDAFGDIGCIQIIGSVSFANFPVVLELTIREIKKLTNKLLPIDTLERYKEEVVGEWLLTQEYATSHLTRIGTSIFYTGEILSIEKYLTALENTKPIDVCEFFQKFYNPSRFALVYISPEEYKIEDILKS